MKGCHSVAECGEVAMAVLGQDKGQSRRQIMEAKTIHFKVQGFYNLFIFFCLAEVTPAQYYYAVPLCALAIRLLLHSVITSHLKTNP